MTGKISKNQVKWIKSLHQKKYRDAEGSFVVEGVKMVGEALASGAKVEMIAFAGSHFDFPYEIPADSLSVSAKELSQISSLKTPQDIVAVCQKPASATPLNFTRPVFALDRIADPGNLGTILRICDWFGLPHLICDEQCVDVYNPKVVRASMGSIFRVETLYVPLEKYLGENHSKVRIVAADTEGNSIYDTSFSEAPVVVLGNEPNGIRREILDQTDETISIPRFGGAESLNVAVSAGIIAAEFSRRS